jgi:tetratricopeptide (TPR) repeat protein
LDFLPKSEVTKEILNRRRDFGDTVWYYKLGKIYQEENNFEEAIINYKKSMPFFGIDNPLEDFF